MDSSHDTLNNAVALHGQGRLEEAIVLYQQVLASRPDDVTVTANLASAFVKTGRLDDGLRLYRELSSRGDNSPEFWFNFANALQRAGEYLEARQAFERALQIAPQFFPAALNLANLVRDLKETDEAVTLYRRAILMKPEHSKPRVNLARLLRKHKRFEETCEVLDAGLRYSPGSVDLLYERAAAGYEAGDSETAFAACQRILKQQPKHGNAHTLVGLVEYERGNVDQAVRWWSELARIEPNNSEPHINLGTLRQKERQLEQAVGHFREAVRRDPVDLGANLKLGLILSTTGHVSEAMQIGRRLTKQFADRPEGYSLLANGFHEQGLCEEARTTFNEALSKKADDTMLIGNALFSSLYSDTLTDEEILNVHQQLSLRLHELAVQHDQPVSVPARPREADTRIRVGYLSPDLLMHPVGYFIEPVLMHHDRSAFEVICYSDNGSADDLTARLRKLDLTWHDCSVWGDVRLEDQIRSDQLDLLIDLTGHTAKNRSMVLARKPASRLATYLGYPGKTERPANDWLIADHDVCPIEMPIDSQEKVVRLPSCFL
ncbi:MAG: tetratricopeptide repeat protein, partial [Planctomycetota bacterium]|nr:tetratricopeptide repeat protein [Planctomycetota bacterium]